MGAPLRDLERKHTIGRLAPHHRAMARAVAAGVQPTDLAQEFGLTPSWVTQIIHSPLFKAEVRRLTGEVEAEQIASQRQISEELDLLLARSVEVIAQELHNNKASARRTDTAFKILDRRGYHPKNDQASEDNRQFNFITLTPEPGENPKEAMKRVNAVVREMKRNQLDGGHHGELESMDNEWSKGDEADEVGEWPVGTYELQRANEKVDGRQVYQLLLTDGSED